MFQRASWERDNFTYQVLSNQTVCFSVHEQKSERFATPAPKSISLDTDWTKEMEPISYFPLYSGFPFTTIAAGAKLLVAGLAFVRVANSKKLKARLSCMICSVIRTGY